MTGADFKLWLTALNLSERRAAETLGLSRNTVASYRDADEVSRSIALACAALAYGLPPWRQPTRPG